MELSDSQSQVSAKAMSFIVLRKIFTTQLGVRNKNELSVLAHARCNQYTIVHNRLEIISSRE